MTISKLLHCAKHFKWIITINPYQITFTTIRTFNENNNYFIGEGTEAKKNEILNLSN